MTLRIAEPTPPQLHILQFIVEYAKDNQNLPSTRQVAEDSGISQPCAHEHMKKLVDKGYLEQRGRHWAVVEGVWVPPRRLESLGIVI